MNSKQSKHIPNSTEARTLHQLNKRPNYTAGKVAVATFGCSEDAAAVATLPDHWEPKHSGPILQNYLKERKEKHEAIHKYLIEEAAKINQGVDAEIRKIAEILLSDIQHNDDEVKVIIELSDIYDKPLPANIRDETMNKLEELFSKRADAIATFKKEALEIEKERADKLRTLLRNQFQLLLAAAHQTPKDLLHDFDERIYDINQQLLSNNRAYAELEVHLRIQADESMTRSQSCLNQLCFGLQLGYQKRATSTWSSHDEKWLERRHTSVSIQYKQRISLPSITLPVDNGREFDQCVSRLVEAYRMAVSNIFTGFAGKLNEMYKAMGCYRLSDTSPYNNESELKQMIERTRKRLSSSVHKKIPSNLAVVTRVEASTVQNSICSLGERLRDTYLVLHSAAHLWDTHMIRAAMAQKLTITAVEDLLTSNDNKELANEVNFNIALVQMCSAFELDKLKLLYDGIVSILDRTADVYREHSLSEVSRLEEYMNLCPAMTNVLFAEFNCFLDAHPRIQSSKTAIEPGQLGIRSPIPDTKQVLNSSLPRAIFQTELQELSLVNWRNGFLESFQNNVSQMPEELKTQAESWIDEKCVTLKMRYSLKMVSHRIRAERVKAAFEDRARELRYHDERLTSHLNAVYNLIDFLPRYAAEFLSLDDPVLYPYCEWLDRIQTSMDLMLGENPLDPEVKRLKLMSYACRLVKHRKLYEESLDLVLQEFKREIDSRFQEARVANQRFMSNIVLFHEGGRFAAQEALNICTALVKCADQLEGCANKTQDALNHCRNRLLDLADKQLLPLQRVCEEVTKGASKGIDKKKKPTPAMGKKK